MNCRPSDLYDIEWPLARFYFDRGIAAWGKFIENKMNEAEANVRKQMKNRRGTDTFVASHRIVTFNKLLGLSVAAAYRQPQLPNQESKTKEPQKVTVKDLSGFGG